MPDKPNARHAAPKRAHRVDPKHALLDAAELVLDDGRSLTEILDRADGPTAKLPPEQRARVRRELTRMLRTLGQTDGLLRPHLRRTPPVAVMSIMRLAALEVVFDKAEPAQVVHEAVDLARGRRGAGKLAGLVNAVLRKVTQEVAAAWPSLPDTRMPGWLRGRVDSAHGRKVTHAIERAHGQSPPVDLTPRDGDGAALAKQVEGQVLPTGSVRLAAGAQISTLPGFETGAFWVQDAAAAVPVRMLGPVSGQAVLDLCAAPGGKTMQLAAAGATVTALDISEQRMVRVRENLDRTGLSAHLVVADAFDWTPDAAFDAILLDAPCSATGTIRRHPDLPLIRSGAELATLVALQADLLDRALAWLKPGGVLVYATCSLIADEGEIQIRKALARHTGLALAPDPEPSNLPEGAWRDGQMRLRPDMWSDLGGMDGFFAARLTKSAPKTGDP